MKKIIKANPVNGNIMKDYSEHYRFYYMTLLFFSALKKITKNYHITPPLENVAGLSR